MVAAPDLLPAPRLRSLNYGGDGMIDEIDAMRQDEQQPTPPPSSPPGRTGGGWLRAALRDLFGTFVPAVIIALLIHVFLAQATRVYGQSMEPNLHTDERLVIEKVSYRFSGPDRGDVVVIRDPGGSPELLIKRVVGLPGERVTISGGRVTIDGVPLVEPYLSQTTRDDGRSWVVPPLHVFVMGDNRSASRDSRTFGPVPMEEIIGRALFRYWPIHAIGPVG